ncbi:hypothetical protein [Streptomyces deserti]
MAICKPISQDLDMPLSGDDGLKEIEDAADDHADEISCFGSPRIILRKGTASASAPDFTARTTLYSFWANYGAVGVLDFFPPQGQHVPMEWPP